MHVIDSSGKMRSDKLPYGPPTGKPVVDGSDWLFASLAGVVWRIDPATGEELAKLDTDLALGSSLAVFGSRLLVAGHDGTLYLIEKP
jgi:streptogramin lyase